MKISVVIPTHNRAKFVEKALKSAMNQTYQNIEIIVVSDGSTDDTDLLLQKYCALDSRIRYIAYKPAKGGNHARNIGIRNAKGKFIAFLDDDDEWMPKKLEIQIKEFDKDSRIGLVYTGAKILYPDRNISYNSMPQKTGDLSKDILVYNCIGTTSGVMIKSSALDKSGAFDENLEALQDYDLWIRICQLVHVGAAHEPLLNYNNIEEISQISDDIKKYEKASKQIYEKYEHLFEKLDYKTKLEYRLSTYMLLANKSLRNNNPKTARKYLITHLKVKPKFKAIIMYVLSFFKYDIILKLRSRMNFS